MMKRGQVKGALVAIVTPFKDGKVDDKALKNLVEFQIKNGSHGIVAVGTTGESPTLTHEEHKQVIEIIVDTVNGRVPVIAGTGSNNTAEAEDLTKFAAKAGADACLSVCPYYNRPTQAGIIDHFEYLADACGLPTILYNIPGRTGINMTVETIVRLAGNANIIGIKEACGSLEQVSQIIKKAPADFAVLSGDDILTLPIMACGGTGVISTASNVAPRLMADVVEGALEGNYKKAREAHYRLVPLFHALFVESNPVPVKTALSMMGLISNEIRMPLHVLSAEHTDLMRKTLAELGIL